MRLAPLKAWPQALRRELQERDSIVRIVLAAVRGSAPREAGVCMLVTATGAQGTIGGGELEWRAVRAAQRLLNPPAAPATVERLVLAADLGQCCGGVVEVWMERFTRSDLALVDAAIAAASRGPAVLESTLVGGAVTRRVRVAGAGDPQRDDLLSRARTAAVPRLLPIAEGGFQLCERLDERWPPLWLYGAGHVGQALANVLVDLPFGLTWIDSRADMLPPSSAAAARLVAASDPVATVDAAPSGTRFLVLTHSHALDFALCARILGRTDFAWVGLIGSKSKASRFRSRLLRAGLDPARVARLVCPIGIDGVASKWPAAIAVAVAAQLLQDLPAQSDRRGATERGVALEPPPGNGHASASTSVSYCDTATFCGDCGAGRSRSPRGGAC